MKEGFTSRFSFDGSDQPTTFGGSGETSNWITFTPIVDAEITPKELTKVADSSLKSLGGAQAHIQAPNLNRRRWTDASRLSSTKRKQSKLNNDPKYAGGMKRKVISVSVPEGLEPSLMEAANFLYELREIGKPSLAALFRYLAYDYMAFHHSKIENSKTFIDAGTRSSQETTDNYDHDRWDF